jgi:hypothetical protein
LTQKQQESASSGFNKPQKQISTQDSASTEFQKQPSAPNQQETSEDIVG